MSISTIEPIITLSDGGFTLVVLTSEKLFFAQSLKINVPFPKDELPFPEKVRNMRDQIRKEIDDRLAKKVSEKREYTQEVAGAVNNENFYTPIQYYTGTGFKVVNKFLSAVKVS